MNDVIEGLPGPARFPEEHTPEFVAAAEKARSPAPLETVSRRSGETSLTTNDDGSVITGAMFKARRLGENGRVGYLLEGPGMPAGFAFYPVQSNHFGEAAFVLSLLHVAYEEGKKTLARELGELLNVPKEPT